MSASSNGSSLTTLPAGACALPLPIPAMTTAASTARAMHVFFMGASIDQSRRGFVSSCVLRCQEIWEAPKLGFPLQELKDTFGHGVLCLRCSQMKSQLRPSVHAAGGSVSYMKVPTRSSRDVFDAGGTPSSARMSVQWPAIWL